LRQRLAIQEPLRKAEGDLTALAATARLARAARRGPRRKQSHRLRHLQRRPSASSETSVPQLAGKSPAEQDRIWHAETLACFSALKTAKFATINLDELTA
jgi:CRISPR/Cas system Type II protein with McrA/HNH and RuvC-like nuclease domain